MQLDEYEKITNSTDISNHSLQFYLDGMSEESGEINGVLKRVRRGDYDKKCHAPVSQEIETEGLEYILDTYQIILRDLLDEIGDREWYTVRFLNRLKLTLMYVLEGNATKVKGRKKDGTILGKGDKR